MSITTPAPIWFRIFHGEKDGPYTAGELRSLVTVGGLARDDLVWREGLADWVPAHKVKGLFIAAPPPLQPAEPPLDDLEVVEEDWASLTSPSGGGATPVTTQVVRPVIVQSSAGSKFASGFFGAIGVMAAIGFMILLVCGGGIVFLMNAYNAAQQDEAGAGLQPQQQRRVVPPRHLGNLEDLQQPDEAPAADFMQQIEEQAQDDMRRIERQVAEDFVDQYDIAKRNGSAMDAYVAAGFVAAAYLQAEDEENYQRWKAMAVTYLFQNNSTR